MKAASNQMPLDDLLKAAIKEKDETITALQQRLESATSTSELQSLQEQLSAKVTEADELSLAMIAKDTKLEELEILLETEKKENVSLTQYTVISYRYLHTSTYP